MYFILVEFFQTRSAEINNIVCVWHDTTHKKERMRIHGLQPFCITLVAYEYRREYHRRMMQNTLLSIKDQKGIP